MGKKLSILFGIVFVLVGLLGFLGGLGIVGPMGFFETNMLHDAVHLLIGIVLLAVAFLAPSSSSLWLKIVGLVYLVVAILGYLLVPAGGLLLGLIDTNGADHILHIVLGVVILAAGFWSSKDSMPAAPMAPAAAPMNPPSAPMGGSTM